MAEIKHYGITTEEHDADDTLKCRKIVRTIIDYGINERQKLKIIYLLALELENRDQLQEISGLIRRIEQGEFQRSTLITEV